MSPILASPDTPNPDLTATATLSTRPTMTPVLASPDIPNPDLTATTTLPTQPMPEASPPPTPEQATPPEPATPPSLLAPTSLFYANANQRPPTSDSASSQLPPTDSSPSDSSPSDAPDSLPLSAPEPSLLAPNSLFYASRTDLALSDAVSRPAAAQKPSLLAPDSVFYAAHADSKHSESGSPAVPETSLLAPTSLFYAPADCAPPPASSSAAEPLLAPTSLFFAAANASPSTSPEPPRAPQPEPATVMPTAGDAEPPAPPPPTVRRAPEPVLVTSEPHDPTAADRRARLVLHHASEPGDALLCRLVARFGAPTVASAILSGSAADLLSPHDEESAADRAALISRGHTLQTRCYRADPDADLAVGDKTGARYIIPADPQWPAALDDLGDSAPLGMWFLGQADLVAASKRGVSIVGARIATGYGMHVAGELAAGLAERGWAIISGAARGIDGAAHRGALAARGVTVAALACGIDLVYPRGHEALIGAIASDGLVVSELPPGTSVSRFRFLDRNRVIAALGLGTLVVEAAARSGSLVTARLADSLGRPVLAVPGPITSEASEGTHQLIRDGALLVTRAAEVVEHLGELGADLAEPTATGRASSRRPRDSLDPIAARVLDALPVAGRGTLDTVEAALAAGFEPRAVHAALGRLDAAGWVERAEKGWCARLLP